MSSSPLTFKGLLAGKRALVTGGTRGIGLAIATALAVHDVDVVLFGTSSHNGDAAVKQIQKVAVDATVEFASVDVADKKAVDAAVALLLADAPPFDIVVNNAGITRDQLLMKMTEKEWDDVMTVNVKSCYNVCHALVRSMIKARGGSIINISSVVGISGNAGQTNYAASKAAIIGFTKALAKEVASRHIRVNCIAPGFIDTAMTETLSDLQKEGILAKIPLGYMGAPSDIANLALFLASPLATYITGQLIAVDGGMT